MTVLRYNKSVERTEKHGEPHREKTSEGGKPARKVDLMKTQKELKAMYQEILENEVWQRSPDMVDYCVKKTAHIVELTNGDIIAIEKPGIETRFCFGYSDSRYDTEDYDRANDMADYASKSQEYFIEENMKGINQIIGQMEGTVPNSFEWRLRVPYSGQPEGSKLKSLDAYYWSDEHAKQFPEISDEDLQRVIEGYKVVKASFEKRLNTYLKRYGMSKVKTWSYWQDA